MAAAADGGKGKSVHFATAVDVVVAAGSETAHVEETPRCLPAPPHLFFVQWLLELLCTLHMPPSSLEPCPPKQHSFIFKSVALTFLLMLILSCVSFIQLPLHSHGPCMLCLMSFLLQSLIDKFPSLHQLVIDAIPSLHGPTCLRLVIHQLVPAIPSSACH